MTSPAAPDDVTCLFCGAFNPREANFCHVCGQGNPGLTPTNQEAPHDPIEPVDLTNRQLKVGVIRRHPWATLAWLLLTVGISAVALMTGIGAASIPPVVIPVHGIRP